MARSEPDAPHAPPSLDSARDAEDRDLARRARAGNRAAFAALHERWAGVVHGVLLSRVPPQDAPDLVQDVFVSALRAIEGLASAERIGPWLCSIARNRATDHLKAKRRQMEVRLEDDVDPPARELPGMEREEFGARVLDLLRGLPEAYRETLTLRLVQGASGPEIAAATGRTPGSVRVNLHRGMKLLRERLDELGLLEQP